MPERPVSPARRRFLQAAGAAGLLTTLSPPLLATLRRNVRARRGWSPEAVARDEDFWRPIQEAYPVDRSMLNLNNGGVSPSPWKVQQAYRRMLDFANQCPSRNMWRIQEPKKENVRRGLARLFGADTDEIAIVRNASEALETVTFGLRLEPGDEVLTTTQDYPRMITAWKQRELRDGIVLRQIQIPTPPRSLDEIVTLFRNAITEKTRVLHFCHVINLTGQIMPVQALCRLARERGLHSLVDGAHAFAHLDFQATDLECDYYGTSLHKWLSAPFGTGMLYVRKERIADLWPLFAAPEPESDDIRKFEEIGTHPCPLFLSIAEAVHFHDTIGAARKQARMRHLRDCWARPLLEHGGVVLHTSLDEDQSCGIANVEIEGQDTSAVHRHLLKEHHIVTSPINHAEFQGNRITPHVYTTRTELDRFVGIMTGLIRDGLPV